MESKRITQQSVRIINPGKHGYLLIAGLILIDLLLVFGDASWITSLSVILISSPLLYIAIRQDHQVQVQGSQISDNDLDSDSYKTEASAVKSIENKISIITHTNPENESPEASEQIEVLLISGRQTAKSEITQHLDNWRISYKAVDSAARAFALMIESALAQRPFQTVLVDQANLNMDDCQFAVALRAEPLLQPLYLIHYGGTVIPTRAEQLHKAGYSKVLPSPIDKTLFYSALHNAKEIRSHHNIVQLLDHYESDKRQLPLEILIASSNSSDYNRLRRMLNNAGHQTFLVTEGMQILDALDSHHFDLAILDADMPDLSGIEAVKLYRFTRLNQPWIPFILLLDNPNSQTIQTCENADINNLLVKPVSIQRLNDTITEAIQQEQNKEETFGYNASTGRSPYHSEDLTLDTHQLEELKRLGKEKGFLMELVNQFGTESAELIQGLKDAVLNQDIKSVRNYGHKLKDTAGNLGALNLYRLAVRTTRMTNTHSGLELDNLVTELVDCRTSTIQALLDHLSAGNNSAYRKE